MEGVQFIVMGNTERHGELITDLLRQPARLGKGDVVGMTGKLLADQARLGGDQLQMAMNLPSSVAPMLQGAILFFVLGGEALTKYRLVRR